MPHSTAPAAPAATSTSAAVVVGAALAGAAVAIVATALAGVVLRSRAGRSSPALTLSWLMPRFGTSCRASSAVATASSETAAPCTTFADAAAAPLQHTANKDICLGNGLPQAAARLLVCTKCSVLRTADVEMAAWNAAASEAERVAASGVKSGELMYSRLQDATKDLVLAGELEVTPVHCMSNCNRSNCIALQAAGKFSYTFANLKAADGDIEDVADFVRSYCKAEITSSSNPGMLTKGKDRPPALRKTCVSRVPPLQGPARNAVAPPPPPPLA